MNKRKPGVAATLALAVFGMTAAPALAQEARSTLSGTITDASGSALVGAQVLIVNTDTGVRIDRKSVV